MPLQGTLLTKSFTKWPHLILRGNVGENQRGAPTRLPTQPMLILWLSKVMVN